MHSWAFVGFLEVQVHHRLNYSFALPSLPYPKEHDDLLLKKCGLAAHMNAMPSTMFLVLWKLMSSQRNFLTSMKQPDKKVLHRLVAHLAPFKSKCQKSLSSKLLPSHSTQHCNLTGNGNDQIYYFNPNHFRKCHWDYFDQIT